MGTAVWLLCSAIVVLCLGVAEHGTVVCAAAAVSQSHRPRSTFLTIAIQDVPGITTALGLKLRDPAAERAFFAKDYSKVSYADFRALWARAEQAKRDEAKLIADHASSHTIICNKIIKVGTEAIVGVIYRDPAFTKEHLQKFRHNVLLAGKTCKDAGL